MRTKEQIRVGDRVGFSYRGFNGEFLIGTGVVTEADDVLATIDTGECHRVEARVDIWKIETVSQNSALSVQ